MKLTETQLDRWQNPPRKAKRKKKNITIQYRSGPPREEEEEGTVRRLFSGFFTGWSTLGKYAKLEDAAKALQTVSRDTHFLHAFEFRVLIKGEHVLKKFVAPEDLAFMLMHWKDV